MGNGAVTEQFSEEELLEHILHFATEGEYGKESPYLNDLLMLRYADVMDITSCPTHMYSPGCRQDLIVEDLYYNRYFKVTLYWEKLYGVGHKMLPPSICEVERVVEIVENIIWKEKA